MQELPFLISKTSTFFKANTKPERSKKSGECVLRRSGGGLFASIRQGRVAHEKAIGERDSSAGKGLLANGGRVGSLTK